MIPTKDEMKIGDKVIFFGKPGAIVGKIGNAYWDVKLEGEPGTIPVFESEMVKVVP